MHLVHRSACMFSNNTKALTSDSGKETSNTLHSLVPYLFPQIADKFSKFKGVGRDTFITTIQCGVVVRKPNAERCAVDAVNAFNVNKVMTSKTLTRLIHILSFRRIKSQEMVVEAKIPNQTQNPHVLSHV